MTVTSYNNMTTQTESERRRERGRSKDFITSYDAAPSITTH